MARHFTNADRTQTWNVTKAGDLWVVGTRAQFKIDGAGIDLNGYANTTVRIFGDISITNNTSPAINVDAGNADIVIGASSRLEVGSAAAAITSDGLNTETINNGRILSGEVGVNLDNGGKVVNNGIIRGERGIELGCNDDDSAVIVNDGLVYGGDSAIRVRGSTAVQTQNPPSDQLLQRDMVGPSVINRDDGIIRSEAYGVVFQLADGNRLVNDGIIRAPKAVFDDGVSTTVINRGRVVGDILLQGGDDVFDGRGGTIAGKVYGGSGSDTFVISRTTTIVEAFLNGVDTLKSTISYALPENVEKLVLLGNASNGTGNGLKNTLTGNKGDNHLLGEGGNDILDGRRGKDTLSGDEGADTFIFSKGYGKDQIVGFEDGQDRLDVEGMDSNSDFAGFSSRIHQVGTNVEIDLGNGDELVILGISKAILSAADFVY